MATVTGVSPAAAQASAAVVNVEAVAKATQHKRDDRIAAIDSGSDAAKPDLSPHKAPNRNLGRNLDIEV